MTDAASSRGREPVFCFSFLVYWPIFVRLFVSLSHSLLRHDRCIYMEGDGVFWTNDFNRASVKIIIETSSDELLSATQSFIRRRGIAGQN